MIPHTNLTIKEKEEQRLRALCDVFLGNGGKITKCRKQRYSGSKPKGGAILGLATSGRAGMWDYGR